MPDSLTPKLDLVHVCSRSGCPSGGLDQEPKRNDVLLSQHSSRRNDVLLSLN